MESLVECRGAPRDLGRAQGALFRADVRRALRAEGLSARRSRWPSLRPLGSGSVLGRGTGREIIRHYPHQGERLAGIALGARVSLASLVEQSERSVSRDQETLGASAAVGASGQDVWLARLLETPASSWDAWILRRSIPEVGFASLELTRPWFVSCFAGVNEEGLAVLLSASPGEGLGGVLTASLLVQDCLQRFDSVDACIDWCRKRPTREAASLLAADAKGDLAKILPGRARAPVLRPNEGLIVAGVTREVEAVLRKDAGNPASAASYPRAGPVCRLLGEALEPAGNPAPGWRVQLFPARRRLELFSARDAEPLASLEAVRTS